MIEFRALGPLTVVIDGAEAAIGGPRQRRLLAMLLVHLGDVVSVDRLADAVFEGEPTEAARTTMRSYIARIRRVIAAGAPDVELVTRAPGYGLVGPPAGFDVHRFEILLEEGRRQLGAGDAGLAGVTLRQALDVWRGDAYAEFAHEEWVLPEAQRLGELRLVAVERLVDAELACGRSAESIARLETLVAEHPLREGFRSQLMLALYRSGRQVDALRAYREYRTTLADEIGLDPSPALADLERRILAHDPSLDLGEAAGEPLRGYRLGRRHGVGPNGTMHEARLAGSDQSVVISVLDDRRVDEPWFVQSFEANAQRIASLNHPAVVGIHDYWRQPGTAFVVNRHAGGETWRSRIERSTIVRDDLDHLVLRIGGALAEAAARGVEHGWVNLDNIVVDDRAQLFLTNFVVCPTTQRHDAVDFAAVLRASVDRCEPRLPGHLQRSLEPVLDAPGDSIECFVAAVTTALAAQPEALDVRPNPFKGLRAFDETDAGDFHGRDELVGALCARIATVVAPRLTLVVGGSGSGKSSVVRAGLVPAVRAGKVGPGWFVTTMLPGASPFKELAEALRRVAVNDATDLATKLRAGSTTLTEAAAAAVPAEGSVLLVIDQFEELFTLTAVSEQAAFLDAIATAVSDPAGRIHVVATLRADFYDRPLAVQQIGALVGDATVTVPPMSPAELEAAIVRPIEALGAIAEPALVAELVATVINQPAALPSLQFTLYELAECRSDRSLTMDDYRQLGGMDHAIASRAEALYRVADADGRAAVRRVFEQLVVVDVDSEPTGRRSSRADLGGSGTAAQTVVDEWSAARLLTLDHDPRTRVPTVQVAHEALLRTWPRLRQWITEDREAIAERQHLREAAAEWQRMNRDEAGLYRGMRLDAALDSLDESSLPPSETEFLDASRTFRAREEREAQDRIDRQTRANRRLRAQLAAIAVALVVSLIVGFVALDQRGKAQTQRDAADAARRDATARELAAAADANIDIDPERSVLLGLRAVATTKNVDGTVLPEALDALHRAVSEDRLLATAPDTGGRLDWNPTDDSFVTEGPEESGLVDIRSATTGESIRSWRGDAVDVNDVAYSADGTMLAVAGDDGVLKVFDPSDGSLISKVVGSGPVWSPTFSADGTRLLAQWIDEQKIRTVDPATGETLAEVDDVYFRMEISPDGRRVIAGTFEEPFAAIFDTGSAEPALELTESGKSSAWSWSHSGTMVAGGGDDGVIRILDARTGDLLASASAHNGPILSIDWSFDDGRLASGSADGTAGVWSFDGSTLSEDVRLSADDLAAGVAGVSFSPDGNRLAVGDVGVTSTKIFDVSERSGGELFNLEAAPSTGAAITADQVVTVGTDGFIRTTDLATGGDLGRLEAPEVGGFRGLAVVDPSGTRIAVQPYDASSPSGGGDAVEIRDLADGGLSTQLDVSDGALISAMAWSPDGSRVVLAQEPEASDGAQIIVDDAETGARLSTLALPALWVDSVALSPDGTRVAFTQSNRPRGDPTRDVVKIWDWEGNDVVAEIPISASHLAYDPDGTHLALTRVNDGRAEVVDTTTGATVATLSGSTSPLNALTFTADGASVVTGGQDGTVRLWDARTGDEQLLLDAEHSVTMVGLDPSGTRLLSLDDSGVARVWALDPDELVSIAESRLTRSLTDAECRRYLNGESCAEANAS